MIKQTILSYTEKENEIDNLKKVALLFKAEKDTIEDVILKNFLKVYNFEIKLVDLKLFNELDNINEDNKSIILALSALLEDNKEEFTINMAISFYSLFEYENERFNRLTSDKKAKIIDYMMSQFNTEESIQHIDGAQTYKAICASFLRDSILNQMNSDTLLKLQEIRKNIYDIWTSRIAHSIDVLNQKESDQLYMTYPIEKIKNFILSNVIISKDDFFADICLKFDNLKTEIEDNRYNEKEPFHNQDGKKKTEEACRDVILHRLKDKYGYDLELTKEKHEANNRVDINIKYRADYSFEVQVECKRDDNSTINTGISEQLIGKYFSSGVQYGIYLIFYFGDKKNKDLLLKKINGDIPKEYKNNIKIVCMDLTLPKKGLVNDVL